MPVEFVYDKYMVQWAFEVNDKQREVNNVCHMATARLDIDQQGENLISSKEFVIAFWKMGGRWKWYPTSSAWHPRTVGLFVEKQLQHSEPGVSLKNKKYQPRVGIHHEAKLGEVNNRIIQRLDNFDWLERVGNGGVTLVTTELSGTHENMVANWSAIRLWAPLLPIHLYDAAKVHKYVNWSVGLLGL